MFGDWIEKIANGYVNICLFIEIKSCSKKNILMFRW